MKVPRLYRTCLVAYPRSYLAEHEDEILATLEADDPEQAVSRRVIARECAALVLGGLRQRSSSRGVTVREWLLLRRRWYIIAPIPLLVALVAGIVVSMVPSTYSAETIMLVVPPQAATSHAQHVSQFDSYSLMTVAAIISDAESSRAAAHHLQGEGVSQGTYTVRPDPTGDTPELIVIARASSAAMALHYDAVVAHDVVSYVYNVQKGSGASPSTFVKVESLVKPEALRT
jgi:hypothetical protein